MRGRLASMSGAPDIARGEGCRGAGPASNVDSMAQTALFDDPRWPRAGRWPSADAAGAFADGGGVDVGLLGVPTWSTSITPGGAHTTPAAVRAALQRYGTFAAGLTWPAVADFGDVVDPDHGPGDDIGGEQRAIDRVRQVAERSSLVVALGGDNALTYPVAIGAYGDRLADAGLITIDAHYDLRDGISNGSPVRRLLEAGVDGRRVAQLGIADFANSTFYDDRAREAGIRVVRRDAFEDRPLREIVGEALAVAGASDGPIHVDVDVDVCDRAATPACPASVPGGLSAQQLRRTVRLLARHPRVVSIDVAEVDASMDAPDGRTVRLAALVVLEAMAGFAERER
jgi:formiminoglutamase